jgi:hypothetical protein
MIFTYNQQQGHTIPLKHLPEVITGTEHKVQMPCNRLNSQQVCQQPQSQKTTEVGHIGQHTNKGSPQHHPIAIMGMFIKDSGMAMHFAINPIINPKGAEAMGHAVTIAMVARFAVVLKQVEADKHPIAIPHILIPHGGHHHHPQEEQAMLQADALNISPT